MAILPNIIFLEPFLKMVFVRSIYVQVEMLYIIDYYDHFAISLQNILKISTTETIYIAGIVQLIHYTKR